MAERGTGMTKYIVNDDYIVADIDDAKFVAESIFADTGEVVSIEPYEG